ncbi:MAG: tetratricopeptide repeat protein [Planctomycetia bacterium]|nr:tetratricopeptide repeat protein [Planctomycetia bacterium]
MHLTTRTIGRCLGALAAALFFSTFPSPQVQAQKIGDVVAVTHQVDLVSGERVVATIDVGNTVVVGGIEKDKLWVNCLAAGWIDKADVVPLAGAVKHFSARLQENPTDAEALYGRGRAWQAQEKWDSALDDYTAAIAAAPTKTANFAARAAVRTRKRDYEGALADYAEVLRLDPLDHQAYRLRAGVYIEMKKYGEAISDYNVAARLYPNDGALNNDRAWLLATCPTETYRNGAQAVKDATLACELCGWKAHNRLGTLAAAYAESGDFEKAVEYQRKCVALAPTSSRQAQTTRLRLYEAGKPHREFAGLWK